MSDPLLNPSERDMSSKEDDSPIQTTHQPQKRTFAWNAQIITCITLHVLLILAHVGLVVVLSHHYEHRVTVTTGSSSNRLSVAVTAISQVIGTIYAAVLVVLTQQLALRRDFHIRQSLSALHDKQTAWLGIGSSSLTLFQQLKVNTAVWSIILITVYLAGIFVFHITTPSLFDVIPFNVTIPVTQPTRLGRSVPLYLHNLAIDDSGKIFPSTVYNILGTLPVYTGMETPGLLNSTIYDIIPQVPGSIGEVTVNATMFQSDCGLIRNVTLGPSNFVNIDPDDTSDTTGSYFDIEVGQFEDIKIFIANPSLIAFTVDDIVVDSNALPTIVVTASVPVADSTGNVGGLLSLDPKVIDGQRNTTTRTGAFQVLGCNLSAHNVTVNVSAVTGRLSQEPLPYPSAVWHDWTEPPLTQDPMLNLAGSLPHDAPSSSTHYCVWYTDVADVDPDGNTTCYFSNVFDNYLQAYLIPEEETGLSNPATSTPVGSAFTDAKPNVTVALDDLNKRVSQGVAAILWYAASLDAQRLPEGLPVSQTFEGEAVIQTQLLRSQLNLNKIPLYVGLATSCLLLVAAWLLIRQRGPTQLHPALDSTGLLQLTWLLGQEPQIAERVAEVEEPTIDHLRRAGMFDVHMGDSVQRRRTASSADLNI